MFLKFIILICLLFTFNTAHSQKASDKALEEACSCIKEIDKSEKEDAQTKSAMSCLSTSITKYKSGLQKEFNITSTDITTAQREIGMQMGPSIAQKCPEIMPYLFNIAKLQNPSPSGSKSSKGDINPDTLKLESSVCALFKTGKYTIVKMFVNRNEVENPDKTLSREIKDGFLFDYEQNKKYVTKWAIQWKSNCEWDQTLVESNSPNINAVLKKGDKVNHKAIGSTADKKLYFLTKMMGIEMIGLIQKL